uniref:Uncharacterized protein n=1 Tax=Physcomitrium patens TaxID=3218 RepID=A0A2K1KHB5_PHYPA|nr:hypothetical protein PHYPA_009530 [Physcomitrium patens]
MGHGNNCLNRPHKESGYRIVLCSWSVRKATRLDTPQNHRIRNNTAQAILFPWDLGYP